MKNPRQFTIGLLLTILMVICIILNIRTIVIAISTNNGNLGFGIFAMVICIIALISDVKLMIQSY